MKMNTADASRELGWHPAQFVLRTSRMVGGLEDCWPEVDKALFDTLLSLFRRPEAHHGRTRSGEEPSDPSDAPLGLSLEAIMVLDKLDRKNHWGKNTVSRRTLHNNYCPKIQALDSTLEELCSRGLLLRAEHDTFTLNTKRKGDVKQAVDWRRDVHTQE